MTTLDTGIINGLSFSSQGNWIVGQNTSSNQVTSGKGGGGQLTTGGLSEGLAPTAANGSGGLAGLSALTLTKTSSISLAVIDFGSTANGSLAASGKGAFVNVLGFTSTDNALRGDDGASTNDRLLFVTDPGFNAVDLVNWQFVNDGGTSIVMGGVEISYNGYYEIVPVPEPATWLAGALLVSAAGWSLRRRCHVELTW